jgi:hypothetical protein
MIERQVGGALDIEKQMVESGVYRQIYNFVKVVDAGCCPALALDVLNFVPALFRLYQSYPLLYEKNLQALGAHRAYVEYAVQRMAWETNYELMRQFFLSASRESIPEER